MHHHQGLPRCEGGSVAPSQQPLLKPHHAQGAGDALLPAEIPPNLQKLLNVLLILATLHFLVQVAIYFNCLFLILPLSFLLSSVTCRTSNTTAATSHENLHPKDHLGHAAGERAEERVLLLPWLLGVQDLVTFVAIIYVLVRAGLIFCNVIFILPLIFFLSEAN